MQTTRFGLKSLPTYYKGITFRSRLEARWAIVFDELGIKWQYEPEAIEIEANHFSDPYNSKTFAYLPDFYLPEFGCIVEVKGDLSQSDYWRLIRIVHYLTGDFACWGIKGRPFILCGNLGHKPHYPMMKSLFNWKGDIHACAFVDFHEIKPYSDHFTEYSRWVGADGLFEHEIEEREPINSINDYLCNSKPFPIRISTLQKEIQWCNAIDRARSARFDRGHYA